MERERGGEKEKDEEERSKRLTAKSGFSQSSFNLIMTKLDKSIILL